MTTKKKKTNSCRKGKDAERAACGFLTSLGFPAERAARNGVKGGWDILCPSLANVHIECKSVKGMGIGTELLFAACRQAKEDAGAAGAWTVGGVYKSNRTWAVLWFEYRKSWRLTFCDRGICFLTAADRDSIRTGLSWLNLVRS